MIKKILHTSDWHLGRKLKGKERHEEFIKFFAWLEDVIKSENIEALLVAGDIFDTSTPGIKAQDIYYSFLSKIAGSSCRHVVIISGNHDSPAFLDAPKDLLKLFKIHVIGKARENPEDEVLILNDEAGNPELIGCAVPYLRDSDVRTLSASDDSDNSDSALINGIQNHYEKVFAHAEELKLKNSDVPVIAMGHLFAKGGKVNDGDGVRALYVGTAVEVGAEIFPNFLAYAALGHLHTPQKILRENIRYSGAPLVTDFGEAGRKKAVNVLELEHGNLINIREISVPIFQKIERVQGNLDEIFSGLDSLASLNESIWLDITYTGSESVGGLQEKIEEYVRNFPELEVLSIRDESKTHTGFFVPENNSRGIEDITPLEMFKLCMDKEQIPDKQRKIFDSMYREILFQIQNGE